MITVQGSCINPRYVTMAVKGSNIPVMSSGLVYTVEIWIHAQERTVTVRFNEEADRDIFYANVMAAVNAFNEH